MGPFALCDSSSCVGAPLFPPPDLRPSLHPIVHHTTGVVGKGVGYPYSPSCRERSLQHHLALLRSAASILVAFRRILSIFIALSLLDTCAAGSIEQGVPHK
jgi:hypothetical protein